MTTPGRGPVRFEGVLRKQETKDRPSGQVTVWESRFFVLNDARLAYFRIKDTKIVERDNFAEVVTTGDPVGVFDLRFTDIAQSDLAVKDGQPFELHPGGGEPAVVLLASSKEECQSWLAALKKGKAGGGGGATPAREQPPQQAAAGNTPSAARQLDNSFAATTRYQTSPLRGSQLEGESDSRSVQQLRVQLRESQLRHEATLDANKKALAAVGTKHYQEKQALQEKIDMLERRVGSGGMGGTLAEVENQLAAVRGELTAERAKATDALQRMEANANRVQALQAELEGSKAVLTVEKKRSSEYREQLDQTASRATELQIESERLRTQLEAERRRVRELEHSQQQPASMRGSQRDDSSGQLQSVLDDLRRENNDLHRRIDTQRQDLERKLREAHAAADAADRETQAAKAELAALQRSASQARAPSPSMVKTDVHRLEGQLAEAERQAEQHRREADMLRETVQQQRADLAEERSRGMDRLRAVEGDRMLGEGERQRLLARIESDAVALEQLQAEADKARLQEGEGDAMLRDQRLVNKALRSRLDEMAEELAEGRDMLGEAEKRVAAAVLNAEREVNAERLRGDELEAALSDAARAADHKNARIGELERSLQERRAQQEAMTQHFDQVVEGLRADTSAAVARATAAEQRAVTAEAELEQVLASRGSTDRIATEAARQLRDLQAGLSATETDRDGNAERARDLEKRYEMATALVDQYKRTNDKQAQEIEELKHEVQLANRRAGTTRSRSPPRSSSRGGGALSVDELRARELDAEAKYAELVRASDSLVEEMTREKQQLQDKIVSLENQLQETMNAQEQIRREHAELLEKNERDVALAHHLRRQLEERDIQLDDKSRQILEASMYQQHGLAQKAADMHVMEAEVVTLRQEKQRMREQIDKQQALLDAKDQAINRERQVMQETLRVERGQRGQLEEEASRLRPLATSVAPRDVSREADLEAERQRLSSQVTQLDAALRSRDESHNAEMRSLKTMLDEERQRSSMLERSTGIGNSGREQMLEEQVRSLSRERDQLQQRVTAVKETLVKKQVAYEQELDQYRMMRNGGSLQ